MKMQALMRQHNTPEPGAILANGPGVHGTLLYFLFLTGVVYEGVMLWSRGGQGFKRPAARRRQVRQHGRFNGIPNELSNLTGPCADYGVSDRVQGLAVPRWAWTGASEAVQDGQSLAGRNRRVGRFLVWLSPVDDIPHRQQQCSHRWNPGA